MPKVVNIDRSKGEIAEAGQELLDNAHEIDGVAVVFRKTNGDLAVRIAGDPYYMEIIAWLDVVRQALVQDIIDQGE